MPDTELAKRLLAVKANCSEDSSGTRWALVDCWLLEEAAAAIAAAREREARYAVYMTDKADQLWQQARAEAMEEAAREVENVAHIWRLPGDKFAAAIRALSAGQGGENGLGS